ncbi:Wzz/FepE/Etk N-terminal domain-containing protein [Prochlorococcus marinus]|uniref:Wzz/FepE/Etk N-terminal domain-containing protein n=1 Tax=Prochlorococcus marinus TaxID=1219 RepID=UPI0005337021|nr:Wzz/FepE/Etk N-terminal domain-containing protein [Prochlorococcus marinus]KGG14254.1 hypothetical protein EV04_0106 [Prochlorococcus marinus str. LG]
MTSDSKDSNESSNQSSSEVYRELVDIKELFKSIFRQKIVCISVFGVVTLYSFFSAITRKPTWEGEFQVVLVDSSGTELAGPTRFGGLGGGVLSGKRTIFTEMKILESPMVLLPVFNFYKDQKSLLSVNKEQDLSGIKYRKWIKKIRIKKEDDTSVLTVTYRDVEKGLVLPVIKKLAGTYQAYSGRDKKRGFAKTLKYLDEQIDIYKAKSEASLSASQIFGMENDLSPLMPNEAPGDRDIREYKFQGRTDSSFAELNPEYQRLKAAWDVKRIEKQLKILDASKDINETSLYFIGQARGLTEFGNFSSRLSKLDVMLASYSSRFKPNDIAIRNVQRERNILITEFITSMRQYLEAKLFDAKSRLASAERPKGVLIKHRALTREANRDVTILASLESDRQRLLLDQAKESAPWELISIPTMKDWQVGPSKRSTVYTGVIAGFVAGCASALAADRLKGILYSLNEINSLISPKLLAKLSANATRDWDEDINLLAKYYEGSNKNVNSISVIPVGNISKKQIELFSKKFSVSLKNTKLIVSEDFTNAVNSKKQLLLIGNGFVTRSEIKALNQKLSLVQNPITEWVAIESDV